MSSKKCKQRKKYPLSSNSSRKKTRTKTRKPKFLSLLRLQLRRYHDAADAECTPSPESAEHSTRQLNLFPLESDNLVKFEDKDDHQYDNVSALLLNPTDNSDDATLNGLLNENGPTTSDDGPPASSYSSTSLPCVYGGRGSLVWAAMKGRERREESEERWVKYSEESSSFYGGGEEEDDGGSGGLLDLKLDHEEILKTWSDKGPLFIGGEAPHETVPDLPTSLIAASHMGLVKDEGKGHRETSVLRYKEKRRSRLFSKCIRYQVRKINAEKRHRFNGRFVKR